MNHGTHTSCCSTIGKASPSITLRQTRIEICSIRRCSTMPCPEMHGIPKPTVSRQATYEGSLHTISWPQQAGFLWLRLCSGFLEKSTALPYSVQVLHVHNMWSYYSRTPEQLPNDRVCNVPMHGVLEPSETQTQHARLHETCAIAAYS